MSADRIAQITLAAYAALAVAIIVWQSGRCRYGRTVWLFHVLNRLYCGLWFRWRSNRRSPLPNQGPALILANHRSPLDPIFVWMNMHLGENGENELRPFSFVMAQEYYDIRGLQWAFRALRSIPVVRSGRDMGPVREALRHLSEGDIVAIFPEGRINHEPENVLLNGDTGVAWLALRAQAPVYPVFIQGAPRSQSMIRPFLTPSRVRVIYGDLIDLSPYRNARKKQELLHEVADLMMTRLAELGNAVYLGSKASPAADSDEESPTVPMERATG